jgi:uracil-DNA glycosylase family 4
MDFTSDCRRCPRLVRYRKTLEKQFPHYYNAPVPMLGSQHKGLLIVGLAPGLHGANASGRVFTGDQSGDLLFATLQGSGFSNLAISRSLDDGMVLNDCAITNAVKCVPPANRPTAREVMCCRPFLQAEIEKLQPRVIVALGRIAHEAVLKVFGLVLSQHAFSHGKHHHLIEGMVLIDSYHCSRYNVQTGRLTATLLQRVFVDARGLL